MQKSAGTVAQQLEAVRLVNDRKPIAERLSDEYIRAYIKEQNWYAPINLGNGIFTQPSIWPDAPPDTPQMGVAKFDFILSRNLPDLEGKRVLDLGCNAGVTSIHMARLGAREVIGIDSDRAWKGWYAQAQFVKQVLEWRCETSYNVRFIDADMRDLSQLDLGEFDVTLALCCLYYISEDEMRSLTSYLSTITSVFLVQGNTIRNDHKASSQVKKRAHPRLIRRVLAENGFSFVTVDDPWCYGRPVVVGHKSKPPPQYRNGISTLPAKLLRKMSYLPLRLQQKLIATRGT